MGLQHKRVVVTRRHAQAGGLTELLTEHGALVIELPTIKIEPPDSWDGVDDSIRKLASGGFDWVAFTSTNAVEKFFSRLGCVPDEVFKTTKIAAVGTSTRELLEERGVKVDVTPTNFTAEALATALGRGDGTILLPRAAEVPVTMVDVLKGAGWQPHEVVAYKTLPADRGEAADEVLAGRFDVVTFTSASTAKGFVGMLGDPGPLGLAPGDKAAGKLVGCLGPVTAEECDRLGLRVDVVAEEHTAAGLVAALTMAT